MNYIKLKFILLTFRELGILGVEPLKEQEAEVCEVYAFRYVQLKKKADLEQSGIYRKLKHDFGMRQ